MSWQREDVLCEFFCIRQRDGDDPDDQGSLYPDPECEVHWAPGFEPLRQQMEQERLYRWRAWQAHRRG